MQLLINGLSDRYVYRIKHRKTLPSHNYQVLALTVVLPSLVALLRNIKDKWLGYKDNSQNLNSILNPETGRPEPAPLIPLALQSRVWALSNTEARSSGLGKIVWGFGNDIYIIWEKDDLYWLWACGPVSDSVKFRNFFFCCLRCPRHAIIHFSVALSKDWDYHSPPSGSDLESYEIWIK